MKPEGRCRARKTTDSIWSMNVPSPKWARKTAPASRHPKRVDRAIIHDSTAAASTQKRTGARTSFPAGVAGGALAAPCVAAGAGRATPVIPAGTGVADEDRARHRRGGQEGAVDAGPQEDDEAEEREDLDEAVERAVDEIAVGGGHARRAGDPAVEDVGDAPERDQPSAGLEV